MNSNTIKNNTQPAKSPSGDLGVIIRKIENTLQTDGGQRFLQYAYSFGAAIVIFGAMVKVLHWWGVWGNIIFGTGMAIECLVFVLYGLDRPAQVNQSAGGSSIVLADGNSGEPAQIVLHGGSASQSIHVGGAAQSAHPQPVSANYNPISVSQQQPQQPPVHISEGDHVGQLSSVSDNVMQFARATETLTKISESLQDSYRYIIDNSQNISQHSLGYVQQMEALNRNISGLNTIYEIQLKSISGQLDSIEQINNGLSRIKSMYSEAIPDSAVIKQETEKMAEQIRELNQIYSRMIQSMTTK